MFIRRVCHQELQIYGGAPERFAQRVQFELRPARRRPFQLAVYPEVLGEILAEDLAYKAGRPENDDVQIWIGQVIPVGKLL